QPGQHDADLLLRRKLPPRDAPNLLHNLLCRFLNRPGFLSHLRSFNGYDGPEILPSSTQPICLMGADAGQWPASTRSRSDQKGTNPNVSGRERTDRVCCGKVGGVGSGVVVFSVKVYSTLDLAQLTKALVVWDAAGPRHALRPARAYPDCQLLLKGATLTGRSSHPQPTRAAEWTLGHKPLPISR